MNKTSKVYISGHNGMVGSACSRLLVSEGYTNLIFRSRRELDLRNTNRTNNFFNEERPEIVILAAAKVGGIKANMDAPAKFLYDNLMIQNNIIEACRQFDVQMLVNIGSSCIFPRDCPQPMKEKYLLTGKLEPTNEGYAIAKIAGLKMTTAYKHQYDMRSLNLMPCNLYGPKDSFDLEKSHVLSALVRKFSDAALEEKEIVNLWGTGVARREFMHVDDLARAVLYFIRNPFEEDFVNVGWGLDISIRELAETISVMTGFEGEVVWDHDKPDGMPRKCLDVSRMRALGFEPQISLDEGIRQMIKIYNESPH